MRPIDADTLPVTHGLFTPDGGITFIDYDAVMLGDIKAAPTLAMNEDGIINGYDLSPVKPEQKIDRTYYGSARKTFYCGWCKRRVPKENKYCGGCGTPVDWTGINKI